MYAHNIITKSLLIYYSEQIDMRKNYALLTSGKMAFVYVILQWTLNSHARNSDNTRYRNFYSNLLK